MENAIEALPQPRKAAAYYALQVAQRSAWALGDLVNLQHHITDNPLPDEVISPELWERVIPRMCCIYAGELNQALEDFYNAAGVGPLFGQGVES